MSPSDAPTDPPTGMHRTRVEWADTDAAGIHHHSVLTRYLEGAEATLMIERGLPGYFPVAPRVRYEAHFESPLFFGQEVVATVRLIRLGTSSMTFEFEVWGETHGGRNRRRAAYGPYVTVHVDRPHAEDARSAPWPKAWVAALGGGTSTGGADGTKEITKHEKSR